MSKERKKRFIVVSGLAVLGIAVAAWLFVPTAAILPGETSGAVALGSPVEIHASSLGQIAKVAVYADGQLLGMEYNLGTGDLTRDFDLKPGQEVRVEAMVTSPLGITREFTSSFNTVAPVRIESMSVDGAQYSPGQRIPPQSTLTFDFNKPVTEAALSFDGGDKLELTIDPDDPTRASLPPTVSFKQGATHLLEISATASDSATLASQKVRANIVKPFSLYGKVEDSSGQVRVELDATAPFADAEAVKAALSTTLPGATVTVEAQKIIITCPSLDHANEYSINLARAEGADGSFLEAPLTLAVSFKAEPGGATYSEGGYRGYVYTPGTSGGSSTAGGGASGGGGSAGGPPPGWPSCCPWPPQ